jgi:deoxyribodipyrimidine photolyase-related protein
MDSYNDIFYKKMRIKLNILIDNSNPVGGKWTYDELNRQKYPTNYVEHNPLDRSLKNKYIARSKSITSISKFEQTCERMVWATNRKTALVDLKHFVAHRLEKFGPYQDAIKQNVVVGYHSCISSSLNIGLISPKDVIDQALAYKVPIQSLEGFLRQIIGWREYIRMKYILHGDPGWGHLQNMNTRIDKSWYTGRTGVQTLDNSIQKVLEYAYASHIERLMLLANYAVLFQLEYLDAKKWFVECFIDGYPWVMLNVSMGVNALGNKNRFMKRAYLTNGTYLIKMGLSMSKQDIEQLKVLYNKFIIRNKEIAKRDYRLAAAVKRIT